MTRRRRKRPKAEKWIMIAAVIAAGILVGSVMIYKPTRASIISDIEITSLPENISYKVLKTKSVEEYHNELYSRIDQEVKDQVGNIELTFVSAQEINEIVQGKARVNPERGTAGAYSSRRNKIFINTESTGSLTAIHEYGHAVDNKYKASNTPKFKKIVEKEIEDYSKTSPHENDVDYVTRAYKEGDTGEYFAESFAYYYITPKYLQTICPETYEYIDQFVNDIKEGNKL